MWVKSWHDVLEGNRMFSCSDLKVALSNLLPSILLVQPHPSSFFFPLCHHHLSAGSRGARLVFCFYFVMNEMLWLWASKSGTAWYVCSISTQHPIPLLCWVRHLPISLQIFLLFSINFSFCKYQFMLKAIFFIDYIFHYLYIFYLHAEPVVTFARGLCV